jgi:mono/diheme cytochrome c family protein
MKLRNIFALGLALFAGAAVAADGKTIYDANCAACHQPDGAGAVGLAPPLLGTLGKRVATPAGRQYVPGVVITGLAGKLVSKGVTYTGIMPSWQQFSDEELAGVVNYVLTTYNAAELQPGHQPFTAAEFAQMREKKPAGKDLKAWRAESE